MNNNNNNNVISDLVIEDLIDDNDDNFIKVIVDYDDDSLNVKELGNELKIRSLENKLIEVINDRDKIYRKYQQLQSKFETLLTYADENTKSLVQKLDEQNRETNEMFTMLDSVQESNRVLRERLEQSISERSLIESERDQYKSKLQAIALINDRGKLKDSKKPTSI
ncbi:hypothetical protein PPL_05047 [Heterostelium album PN500]|uniref:Uncharacterized protein n=1 Tax=Heterostelium pallidum (strain ATCC 26659 / Pp 5 / PN500) TaxID=670386 RepID=D3B9A3_HETP5|nr:hypothetical protein PPL_05047 [Heterostelium album PN500]EFA81815.1 hypothetical protein PPL_05047 [Heterostelium album PN500]|eukprot:XP_020433932.1 hypothetical protein PPL_05047 [Heterostelium album PN500]